ncbi:MAG: urate hydroxylase PuuD [Polyangiaceae bacterium]|nr:urate hydroxylase PuuD [Polyangiaceae bacterium]
MLDHVSELVHIIARWVHLIAGIMWIGNSMLFNWIDRNLEKPKDAKPGNIGNMWMVHSGGFYELEKKHLAPSQLPDTLHWFKWQNGITWLSGISLLILIYYLGANR